MVETPAWCHIMAACGTLYMTRTDPSGHSRAPGLRRGLLLWSSLVSLTEERGSQCAPSGRSMPVLRTAVLPRTPDSVAAVAVAGCPDARNLQTGAAVCPLRTIAGIPELYRFAALGHELGVPVA